jgi:hypothetical protein
MKKLFFLSLIFSNLALLAQDKCDFKDVVARMGSLKASVRRAVFKDSKFKALGDSKDRLKISYTVASFAQLLQFTSDVSGSGALKYNGMRVYFAVNPNTTDGDYDKLNLVFVPTIDSVDDIDSCWIIKPGALSPTCISASEASTLIKEFQNGKKYLNLNRDGKKMMGNHFEETKSLWYDAQYLGNYEKGLLYFFNCKKTKLKTVDIEFGGFGLSFKYAYHLTLLFHFTFDDGEGYDISFTTSRSENLKETFDKNSPHLYGEGDVDTGVPCPPPPSGQQTCPGSLLPIN